MDMPGFGRFGAFDVIALVFPCRGSLGFFLYRFRLYYCGHIHCWSALDWPMWLDVGNNLLSLSRQLLRLSPSVFFFAVV